MAPDGKHESLWIATAHAGKRPPLQGKAEADVCVVGAGIVGITSAYLLAREGRSVVVLDRHRILEGVTGKTTAKLTSQHGLVYESIRKRFGQARAQIHADASELARRKVLELMQTLREPSDYVEADSYVFTEDPERVADLRTEADVARSLGLPAEFTTDTELPFQVAGAVRFTGQGHFHPRKYLLALAEAAEKAGARIHEDTAVLSIDDGSPCKVTTEHGTVEAKHVVVATHVPINDRSLFVMRMQAKREYVLALPQKGAAPKGMYVNCDTPRRSVRPYEGDGKRYLIVAGESHVLGEHEDTERHYDALQAWSRQHFHSEEVAYRWSTQDAYPVDDVPLIGRYGMTTKHCFAATGFRAWGMTMGTAAAMMMRDLIVNGESTWSDLYDPYSPSRILKGAVQPAMMAEMGTAVKGLLGRRLQRDPAAPLKAGEGHVMDDGLRKLAVCRDRDGKLHTLEAACTHMGCIVSWNTAEQSWDCPCHGSRFAPSGEVLHGPAVKPLERARAPEGARRPAREPRHDRSHGKATLDETES